MQFSDRQFPEREEGDIPLVSILVAVYKVPEPYLRQCIESLIAQTLKDIEIIIVDDGSPDNCGAICDEYALQDNRICVIHQENQTLPVARNTGIAAARGEYITFVDADDWIDAETCEVAYHAAIKHGADMVFWDYYAEYSANKKTTIPFSNQDELYEDKRFLQANTLAPYNQYGKINFNAGLGVSWCKIFSRSLFDNNNLWFNTNLPRTQDIEMSIRVFEHIKRAYYLNRPFSHYRFNEESNTKRFDKYYAEYCLRMLSAIKDDIKILHNNVELNKRFYEFSCSNILLVSVNYFFHPKNPDSFRRKIKDLNNFINNDIFQESLKHLDYSVFPPHYAFSIRCVQRKWYVLVWFMCKIRRLIRTL